MAKGFLTRDDTSMRLDNTICFYDNKPYYVRLDPDRAETNRVILYKIGTNRTFKAIDVTDDKFDYRSPRLGYFNYCGNSIYLSRIPDRRNKQGLHTQVIVSSPPHLLGGGYFNTKEMESMLLGEYPSQKIAFNRLTSDNEDKGEIRSIAFHPDLCYKYLGDNMIGMFYKERLIALHDRENNRFDLINSPEMSFIERILNKLGVVLDVG